MTNEELLKRIEALEQRVRDLEARPVFVPISVPAPTPVPAYPSWPQYPYWYTTTPQPLPPAMPVITC